MDNKSIDNLWDSIGQEEEASNTSEEVEVENSESQSIDTLFNTLTNEEDEKEEEEEQTLQQQQHSARYELIKNQTQTENEKEASEEDTETSLQEITETSETSETSESQSIDTLFNAPTDGDKTSKEEELTLQQQHIELIKNQLTWAQIQAENEEEDQSLWSIGYDSLKSGIPRTAAGLLKFMHETNYTKYTYKNVIKEHGSIEKAMEADDPRALLAQEYKTQDGEVIETTEYLMNISNMVAPDVKKDVVSAFLEGRTRDFVEGVVSGVAQNIPDLITRAGLTVATGNPWIATAHIFGSVAGQKMIEMEELEGYSDSDKMLIAGLQGSVEYLAERLGTGNLLNHLVKQVGMESAKGIVRTSLINGTKGFIIEGVEEFSTQWVQSAVDYIFGLQTDWDWGKQWNQALNAGTIGGATGLFMGVGGTGIQSVAPNTDTNISEPEVNIKPKAPNENFKFNTKKILEDTGDVTDSNRVETVQHMIETGTKYAKEIGLDPRIIVALMGHESNFKHIEAIKGNSTAKGALQINDGAMETVGANYTLENNPESVEGRIEAGVKYLDWIKTNFGFTGDALIASYYAGAGEISKNGIHNNKIYNDSASPQEYLKEFHNMLQTINNSEADVAREANVTTEPDEADITGETDVTIETDGTSKQGDVLPLVTPESEEFLNDYFKNTMNNVELKDAEGQWTDEALSEFSVIREQYGNTDDDIFTNDDSSKFTPEFKETLAKSLQDRVDNLENLGEDSSQINAPKLLKILRKQGYGAEAEGDIEGLDTSEEELALQQETKKDLQNLTEQNFEKGFFDEINREAIETNNNLISDSVQNKLDSITEEGSATFEINDAEAFYNMIVESKKNNDYEAFVNESNVEDLSGKRLFVYDGGAMGFALESDGNITNVFKNPKLTTESNTEHEMLMQALSEGGNKLDSFSGFSKGLYTSHGFVPVAKTDFVEEFAPKDWNYDKDGKPPIVFAIHNGDSLETVQTNYDNASNTSNEAYYKTPDEDITQVETYEEGKEAQARREAVVTDLKSKLENLKSIEDKRTKEARELKQEITNLEYILDFEQTDETIDEANKRLQERFDKIEDKRTKEARDIKAKLKALKKHTIRSINMERTLDSNKEGEDSDTTSDTQRDDSGKTRIEINSDLEKKVKEYIRLKAKEGLEVSKEEALRLITFNKPSNGNAINTTVFDADNPAVLKLVDEIATELKGKTEKTFKNIEQDAQGLYDKEGVALKEEMGLTARDGKALASILKKAPSVVYKYQHLVSLSAEEVTNTAQQLNATKRTLSELELANFARKMQAHFELTNDLLNIKSGWGRTGVAMKHNVNGRSINADSIDPQLYETDRGAQAKVKSAIDTLGGAEKVKQLIEDVATNNYDLKNLNKKVRGTTNKRITRAILENMSISVLGQWKTHIANIMSQATFTLYANMVNYSQATVNLAFNEEEAMDFAKANAYLIGSIKGLLNSFLNPVVSLNDASEAMFGEGITRMELAVLAAKDPQKFEQIREAAGLTGRIQTEFNTTHALDTESLMGSKGKNNKLINKIRQAWDYTNSFRRNTTFGLLQAGDSPFASAGYHAQLTVEILSLRRNSTEEINGVPKEVFLKDFAKKAVAHRKIKQLESVIEYRVLKEAGLKSKEAQQELRQKIYSELTGGILDQVTPYERGLLNKIDQRAIEHSDEMTWKDPFEKGTPFKNFENFINAHPTTRIFAFLFYHTPMKILQRALNDTVRPSIFTDIFGFNGKKAQVETIGTVAVSYGIIAMSALLYSMDLMTGTPRDEKERKLMKQADVPPNSTKIGGTWLSYNRLEPAGYFLSMGANGARAISEALEDPDIDSRGERAINALAETGGSMIQTMLNKSSLTGVLRTVNMLVNGGAAGYFKGVGESMDPLYSMKKNIFDISYGGINPFYSDEYREDTGVIARDTFGKPITKYNSLTQLNPTEPTDSPIRQELYDLQLSLPGFGNVFNGTSITAEQRNEILRYFDEEIGAEDVLNTFVDTDKYKEMTTPQKRLAIERRWARLKTKAQIQLVKDADFMKALREQKEQEKEDFLTNETYEKDMFRDDGDFDKVKDIIERINIFKRGD